MSSTYSTSLRIQLIDTGTEFEAWGQPTDNNLGTIIEQAIVGSNVISITNLTSYTLTTANAAVDEARNAVLVFTGALSADCNVIAPSVSKVYVVSNQTTGNKFVNITTGAGNSVQVINGTNQLVYCNGTDFVSAVNVNTVIGNLSVSGNSTVGGSVTIGGNILASNVLASSNGNITTTSNTSIVKLSNNNGALVIPTGNTAQRPSVVKLGMQRWNTSLNWMEVWNGVVWYPLTGSYGVTYVVVAGGGSGGNYGGGGAGGALVGGITVQSGTAYSVVIGAGGTGGNAGVNTTALGFTAYGGGSGDGGNGGSGGGTPNPTGAGLGTTGQGNNGGTGPGLGAISGGGGGASAVGGSAEYTSPFNGGVGGAGTSSSISGTLKYYAGGGGGNSGQGSPLPAQGGVGGGGNGRVEFGINATDCTPGAPNTGGGGGGGNTLSGSGGSGICIISYASPTQVATGGTVTSYTSGSTKYWVHTFTTSGTFTA